MLLDVVDEGTALQAALDNYLLAGKTGTPRGTVRGHYVHGRYNPNFVGLFPGDNPQYVIVVKLSAPQAAIYAAETAAPVTKAILEAALAARNAALDRSKLASSEAVAQAETAADLSRDGTPPGSSNVEPGTTIVPPDSDALATIRPYVVTLPAAPAPPVPRAVRAVPSVRGLGLRDAVRSLHNAGFRVQLARGPGQASTSPATGELAPTGTLVRLLYDY
jgi:membrane peptidoglycan carboxypeptidase